MHMYAHARNTHTHYAAHTYREKSGKIKSFEKMFDIANHDMRLWYQDSDRRYRRKGKRTMKLYKALVKDQQELKIIESEYPSKQAFIKDLRANGYKVNPIKVKEAQVFDDILNNTNGYEWDWKEGGK